MRAFNIYSHRNFHNANTVLTTVTGYTSCPCDIHSITGSLYLLSPLFHPSPHSPSADLFSVSINFFVLKNSHVKEIKWYLSFSDLIHLVFCLKVYSFCSKCQDFLVCSWIVFHSACVHTYTAHMSHFLYPSIDLQTQIVSISWLLVINEYCSEREGAHIFSS